MVKELLNKFASRIKGNNYQLDSRISITSLLLFAWLRFINLIRGAIVFRRLKNKVFIDCNVTLRNKRFIRLLSGVTLGRNVYIDGLSEWGVNLGRNVNIGPFTIIQATGIMTNLGKGLYIGDNSGVGAFSFFGCGGGVKIGKNVIMGQYISFHAENHNYDRYDIPIREQGVVRKGITIGDNCWVGSKVTFIDGVVVGSGCVIAAGSVVRGVIPDNSVIGGVPAKIIKSR